VQKCADFLGHPIQLTITPQIHQKPTQRHVKITDWIESQLLSA